MSADGTTFVVGARLHDGSGADAGSSDTVNRYAQFGFDIDGKITRDFFRFSVSLSADGTTFIVGAPYNDANSTDVDVNSNFGHVRAFKRQTPTTNAPSMAPTKQPTISPSKFPTWYLYQYFQSHVL